MSSPEYRSKEADVPGDSSHDEVESMGPAFTVDKMTERKLMRKLDIRLVPMIMGESFAREAQKSHEEIHGLVELQCLRSCCIVADICIVSEFNFRHSRASESDMERVPESVIELRLDDIGQ